MSVLISGLVLFAPVAQADAAEPPLLNADFIAKASTADLARKVLPPEIREQVVGHKLTPPQLHWVEGYSALFWGKAVAIRSGVCQRATWYVSMPQRTKGALTPNRPVSGSQIKMATDCAIATEPFVHLNGSPPEQAAEVLGWLSDAQIEARGNGVLSTEVECRSEHTPNPCVDGARQVLAELPLERTYIVERGREAYDGESWRIAIKSADAPNFYWQVSIFKTSTDRRRVRLSWDVIPPY